MEITEAKRLTAALCAKSQATTLDELRQKGRQEVKVIRGKDVASMIKEAVYRALKDTELLSEEDLEVLVEQGAAEFKEVFSERQREAGQIEARLSEVRTELEVARARVQELEELLSQAQGQPASGPPAEGASAELMMRMMQEMAEMKANLAQGGGGGGGGGGEATGLAAALDKISANLNDRLDKFGRKMGVSSAVEGSEVKYDALFKDDDDTKLESNMGDVQAKKKTGGGIAGNLAKLKKLKGDG
jgi:hypothetical protein